MSFIKPIRRFVLYKVLRKTTYGVRVAVLDKSKEPVHILLVKHPYDEFWVLPGGGVNADEDMIVAGKREVTEETQIKITGQCEIFGTYHNNSLGKNDYVTVIVADSYKESDEIQRFIDKLEIEKCKFWPTDKLPEISRATRDRIDEILNNKKPNDNPIW